MKIRDLFILTIVLTSCSSVNLVDSWRNPEIGIYDPYKVLVVGLTPDNLAKQEFEIELKKELELRGSEVQMSFHILNNSYETNQITEGQLEALENQLIKDGFDTIILSKITGVENKRRSFLKFNTYQDTYRKFKDDYLMYQKSYFNPNENDKYSIYKAETAIYCICPTKERELIWKGNLDIINPKSVNKTVKGYLKTILMVLEEQQIVPKIQ